MFLKYLTEGTPYLNDILFNTKSLIWKYIKRKFKNMIGYDLLIKIINKIVSNSHVGSDPLGCGIYIFCSQINHSCDNNCSFWTENGIM